jgi:hypothetical protein
MLIKKKGDKKQAKTLGIIKTKRRWLLRKIKNKNCKVLSDQKSAFKGRFKDLLSHTFVNILAIDFD